jgi:DNA replication protein DnaC
MINQLRTEVNRIKSGNTKVGAAKSADDANKLEGSTKQEVIDLARSEVDLDGVEFVRFNNVVSLGPPVEGKTMFSGSSQYIAISE